MSTSRRSVVIHGHFYQPPRENPWTGEVPRERSAEPFHDWNERITEECYGPVTRARVLESDGSVARRLNTLEWISFDFGPTLLQWLERETPGTYALVLEADRRSRARANGHGNAIAQPYHHVILPLASRRDKQTEVPVGHRPFRAPLRAHTDGHVAPRDGGRLRDTRRAGVRGARSRSWRRTRSRTLPPMDSPAFCGPREEGPSPCSYTTASSPMESRSARSFVRT